MSRMLDLVRASALPFHQMTSASKGALHVPAPEMVEILVYLAEHNKIFADTARLTLASFDEAESKKIAADPQTPKEVLDYWTKNIRPALFPMLVENSSVSLTKLSQLAGELKGDFIDVMIASPRVRNAPQVLQELCSNHQLSGAQAARVRALIEGHAEPESNTVPIDLVVPEPQIAVAVAAHGSAHEHAFAQHTSSNQAPVTPQATAGDYKPGEFGDDPEAESALVAFFKEHATEIAAEGDKPFQPIGGFYDEMIAQPEPKAAAAAVAAASAPTAAPQSSTAAAPKPAIAKPPVHKTLVNPNDERRGSVLQKINKLDVKGRIQLAMKGNKEERSILIRDGTKLVALAVLDSPKITDGEVEKFASQKNVLEAVLRAITMKRRFAKNYAITRNLVFNPRTPLDVALGLMKNLLTADLKNLAGNKEVSETIRKLALRMFKQKSEASKKN
jgi:hypothetical protein